MPAYDDGEGFAAGDDVLPQFDNDRLIALVAVVRALVPEIEVQTLIRLAILRAIFGEAEDR